MPVSVKQFALTDTQSQNIHRRSDFDDMDIAVTGTDRPGQYRKAFVDYIKVTHHAVGYGTSHAKSLMDSDMNFPPPSGDAVRKIHVLDHGSGWTGPSGH